MKILFANIWNRNIKINWNYDFVDDKWFIKKDVFKQKTKEIFENLDNWKDKIQLNILDIVPLEKFDKIYLVWTNQGGEQSNQDTIYVAKIIEKLLWNEKIEVIEYTANPTDRKAVLYYFKKVFNQRVKKEDKLYLLVSWGVPAMKEAMVWAGLSEDFDTYVLEVINWELKENNIEDIYLKEIYKKTLKQFVLNYDWFWAEKLIEENKRLFGDKVDFLNKLKYVNARFNFDFQTANNLVDNLKLSLIEEDIFQKIEIKNDLEWIKELLDNIEVTYKKWEYTLLLWKIFRLQESLYRYIFEKNTNISTKKDENKSFEDFVNFVESNERLKNYLIENNVKYSEPNTFVLAKILSYFKDNKKLTWADIALFQIANSIDKLKEIRNLSIVAHWWKWVSKNDLDSENIIEKVSTIREKVGMWENIFDQINDIFLWNLTTL